MGVQLCGLVVGMCEFGYVCECRCVGVRYVAKYVGVCGGAVPH